ncbi:MAG: N-acetylmuramoyl-L-alanine amidase [Pseudomonadota bacterium]
MAIQAAICIVLAIFVTPISTEPSFASNKPAAADARLAGDEKRTRFVLDIDRAVAFRIFTLADPYRIVLELPEVGFDLDGSVGRQGRGLVTAFRYGQFAAGKSRVVLDASAPVKIDKAFILEPIDDQPARLVVDLVPSDRRAFLREMAALGEEDLPDERVAIGTQQPESILGRKPAPAPPAPPIEPVPPGGETGRIPVVVIDPGHGGIDPGAVGKNGTREKEIVLKVAQLLADKLRETERYEVALTRADDTFIRLDERVAIARAKKASLFISLHADAIGYASIGGATIYTRSERASDAFAARIAESENRADLIAGVDLTDEPDDVAGILFDLVRRETRNFSVLFSRTLIDEMRGDIRLNKNPARSARFHVLKAPDVPSVLVELGYLTNAEDERVMNTHAWQDKMTNAVSAAVEAYFGKTFAQGPRAEATAARAE